MSLNTAHAHGGVLIYAGERILIYYDRIEMSFEADNVQQFRGNKKGRIFLTTHRVIFNSGDAKDMLQSFSIPFRMFREVELEQPTFGANYIKGKIISETGGNWTGTAKFKMWFKSGGAIEFGQAMLQAAKLASKFQPAQPPPYSTPSGPYSAAPPPAYVPPPYNQYGWIPYQTFPTAPPEGSVYTAQAPPPYPGIDPSFAPQPQPYGQGHYSAADAKAREAGASAYYNHNNPHTVYMPPTDIPTEPPPSYDSLKKTE